MSHILVIEDDQGLREELVNVLELEGYAVEAAENGRVALDRIRQRPPDLVICDLMMPELDGYQVLQAIRGDPATETLAVLLLTGCDDRDWMRRGMELGADDYITKPFKLGALVRAVRAAFEKRARLERQAELKVGQLREQIAAALPHELRTPLACIMGYAEILADATGGASPHDVAELAAQILGAGRRLNRMSENALLYVQLELLRQGRGNVRGTGASVSTPLHELVAFEAQARAKAYARETDLVLDLGTTSVGVSRAYAAKIVEELVDNAFKFSPAWSPVHVATIEDGPWAILRVSNAGGTMTAEQAAAIGAFVQFDRNLREQQGLGLGLSIVRGVTQLWGGTLSVESRPGIETTVSVSLPAAGAGASVGGTGPGPVAPASGPVRGV